MLTLMLPVVLPIRFEAAIHRVTRAYHVIAVPLMAWCRLEPRLARLSPPSHRSRRQGVDRKARIGYSVGLDYPPGWGEQTVSLRPEDTTVLEENMTIHCIPSLMSDDWGIEISETLVIGERRSEPLSKLPRDVVVKT